MTERRFTTEEVLKALYCCNASLCEECPVTKKVCYEIPLEVIAAEIIKGQKAEIELLRSGRREDKEHKFRCETCRHKNKDRDDDHPCRECVDQRYWE